MSALRGRLGFDHKYFMKYFVVAFLGAVFALALNRLWGIEGRWFYVVVAGIVMLSVSMVFVARFSDLVLIGAMFAIPVAGFLKWFFLKQITEGQSANIYSGLVGVGLYDFLIVGLYMSWFFRIFAWRTQFFPRLNRIDAFVFLVILSYVFAFFVAYKVSYSLYSFEYLMRFVLLYFYLSRNLHQRHIPWFVAALCVAIVLEAGLGFVQHFTGQLLGIGLDKGAGGEDLNYQYVVPGLEDFTRATGTTFDSHALGLFATMLSAYPLVFMFQRKLRFELRLLLAGLLLLGMVALLFSFSRSAWLVGAGSLAIAPAVMLLRWRETQVIPGLFFAGLVALVSAPWSVDYVLDRFGNAPGEVMTVRFEQWAQALYIWGKHLFFGVGPGNYIVSLRAYSYNFGEELPVHNAFLFIGAETGIFGVLAFYTLVLVVALRLLKWVWRYQGLHSRLALAMLVGLFAYILDGMSNPLFREPVLFTMFWFIVAWVAALPRIVVEERVKAEALEQGPG